ncbi:MAG: hypothetical protein L6R00_18220 [Phycisphaerae bacterium]|nr:hypothetical protein [Phycisphaerae bacterium]
MIHAALPGRRFRRRMLWTGLILAPLLVIANVQQFGRFWGGHYDWECADCKVLLYRSPAKNLQYLEVPKTYKAHRHDWRLIHGPPSWSWVKPWQWLVFVLADANVLKVPDPNQLFPTTKLNLKRQNPTGLRVLASDPNYQLRDMAMAEANALESNPPRRD